MIEYLNKRICKKSKLHLVQFKKEQATILVREQSLELQGIMWDLKMTEGQTG